MGVSMFKAPSTLQFRGMPARDVFRGPDDYHAIGTLSRFVVNRTGPDGTWVAHRLAGPVGRRTIVSAGPFATEWDAMDHCNAVEAYEREYCAAQTRGMFR